MPEGREIETEFVNTFVQKNRRDRWLLLLANPRRRHEILKDLYHRLPFIESMSRPVPARDETAECVERLL